jgi:hypothetical protein
MQFTKILNNNKMNTVLGNYPIGSKQSRAAKKDARQDKREDRKQARKEDDRTVKEKVGDAARTVTFTPTRGAFLLLVRTNVFGLADVLNIPNDPRMSAEKKARAKVLVDSFFTKWKEKFGGNRTELAETIAKGAKERAFGFNLPIVKKLKFVEKLKAAGAVGFIPTQTGLGADPATDTAAAAGTALPILIEVGTILTALAGIIQSLKKPEEPAAPGTTEATTPGAPTTTTSDAGSSLMSGSGTLIGLAALAAIYFGTMSKK